MDELSSWDDAASDSGPGSLTGSESEDDCELSFVDPDDISDLDPEPEGVAELAEPFTVEPAIGDPTGVDSSSAEPKLAARKSASFLDDLSSEECDQSACEVAGDALDGLSDGDVASAPSCSVEEGRLRGRTNLRNYDGPKTMSDVIAAAPTSDLRRTLKREFSKVSKAAEAASSQCEALATVHNRSSAFHLDERVVANPKATPGRSSTWRHGKTILVDSVIKEGFTRLGCSRGHRFRATSHGLDCAAICALAHDWKQEAYVEAWHSSITTQAEPALWAVLLRNMDATPVHVRFGTLADLIKPVSRYWWRDVLSPATRTTPAVCGSATLLSYEEYMKRGIAREPNAGYPPVLIIVIRW